MIFAFCISFMYSCINKGAKNTVLHLKADGNRSSTFFAASGKMTVPSYSIFSVEANEQRGLFFVTI